MKLGEFLVPTVSCLICMVLGFAVGSPYWEARGKRAADRWYWEYPNRVPLISHAPPIMVGISITGKCDFHVTSLPAIATPNEGVRLNGFTFLYDPTKPCVIKAMPEERP